MISGDADTATFIHEILFTSLTVSDLKITIVVDTGMGAKTEMRGPI
jgi:hypothetical protein